MSDVVHNPPSTEDEDIGSPIIHSRLGYEPSVDREPVILCADEAERQFLINQQNKYRHMPDLTISRLREAQAQLKLLANSYGGFNQKQQADFTTSARKEIEKLQQALDELEHVPRPARTSTQKKLYDARNGAILQMVEAASLGMPLEVWKTHLGRYRNQRTFEGLRNIYRNNGGGFSGVAAFWRGTTAKMIESGTKGSVLMFSKEFIKDTCLAMRVDPTMAGFLAGAGGGVCQVTVMGPCTYLVTSSVTGDRSISMLQRIKMTWAQKGIAGFYPGGVAIAFRQATNWASRQGFTDAVRELIKKATSDNPATAKLTVGQEVAAGIIGGTLACWNQPFEVARIEAQARAAAGEPSVGMMTIFKQVVSQNGPTGLFKGVVPRIFLGIWQTTFMVTGANLIRERILGAQPKTGH